MDISYEELNVDDILEDLDRRDDEPDEPYDRYDTERIDELIMEKQQLKREVKKLKKKLENNESYIEGLRVEANEDEERHREQIQELDNKIKSLEEQLRETEEEIEKERERADKYKKQRDTLNERYGKLKDRFLKLQERKKSDKEETTEIETQTEPLTIEEKKEEPKEKKKRVSKQKKITISPDFTDFDKEVLEIENPTKTEKYDIQPLSKFKLLFYSLYYGFGDFESKEIKVDTTVRAREYTMETLAPIPEDKRRRLDFDNRRIIEEATQEDIKTLRQYGRLPPKAIRYNATYDEISDISVYENLIDIFGSIVKIDNLEGMIEEEKKKREGKKGGSRYKRSNKELKLEWIKDAMETYNKPVPKEFIEELKKKERDDILKIIDEKIDLTSIVSKNIFDENTFNVGMAYNEWKVGEEITDIRIPTIEKKASDKKKVIKNPRERTQERRGRRSWKGYQERSKVYRTKGTPLDTGFDDD